MGPGVFSAADTFWKGASENSVNGVRLRASERFGAVALTKRFAGMTNLAESLGFKREEGRDQLRFPDTSTVAARLWLAKVGLDPDELRQEHGTWSGQWLFRSDAEGDEDDQPSKEVERAIREAREQHGPPPAYLAVLKMDGDKMGDWLRGQNASTIGEIIDPKMKEYFQSLSSTKGKESMEARLATKRPVGPALHAAISSGLAHFATKLVPAIVTEHQGTLIYAGGDDVLALLPTRKAIQCAKALNKAFQSKEAMGSKATLSAGLLVVHHKEDLRGALRGVDRCEKEAKQAGRDALQLGIWRRSGERVSVTVPWDKISTVEAWVDAFDLGATDRWAYQLRGQLPTLEGLDLELFEAEAGRQLSRMDDHAGNGVFTKGPHGFVAGLHEYVAAMNTPGRKRDGSNPMRDWVLLAQSASFLARGRDR
jgi:CRISPR-associated protein Cmr2